MSKGKIYVDGYVYLSLIILKFWYTMYVWSGLLKVHGNEYYDKSAWISFLRAPGEYIPFFHKLFEAPHT